MGNQEPLWNSAAYPIEEFRVILNTPGLLVWVRAENWRLLPDHWLTSKLPCFTGLPVNWPVKCNTPNFDFIQYNKTPFYTVGTTEWQNHMYVGFVNFFLRVSLAYLGCRVLGNKTGTSMEFSENSFQNLLYKWFCLKWNPKTQISSSFLEKISKRELANNIYRTHGKNISDYRVIRKYFIYHCFTGQMWLGWSICWILFDRFYRLTGH